MNSRRNHKLNIHMQVVSNITTTRIKEIILYKLSSYNKSLLKNYKAKFLLT